MKQTEQKILERIDYLVQKGQQARDRHNPNRRDAGGGGLDYTLFNEWKNSSENLIVRVGGESSPYYKNFVANVTNARPQPQHAEIGIGILKALKDDIENGFLTNIKELVVAEVFTDFLDIATHLLEAGYKDPAASLVGAVLEDGLRKICEKHGVQVRNSDDIGSLNTKLADKEVYNRLDQKQIQAWKAIRDSADHGKFSEYKAEHVKALLEGVQRFLTENL
jgi:hypothetical protein